MKLALTATMTCVVGLAHAGPRLFVLRANSSADWETRKHVEASVLGLARNVDRGVGMSDTTFAELASAVGCIGDLGKCKDPILYAMAIDEIVDITITPTTGDQVKVIVRRAGKIGGPRSATAVVDKSDPDRALVAGIGPLFGASRIIGPATPKPASKTGPAATTGPVVTSGRPTIDDEDPLARRPPPTPPPKPAPARRSHPVRSQPAPTHSTTTASTTEPDLTEPAPTGTESTEPTDRPRRDRVYLGGMIGGGVLAIAGVLLWQKAGSLEDEAAAAPDRTRADIDHLLDLESRGDRYATIGNIAFVAGVAVAATCGVLYLRHRKRANDTTAHLTPIVVPGGGGITLTLGVP